MSIEIKNQYLPKDTKALIPRYIKEQDFGHYNFAIIYRLPDVQERQREIRIKINERIDIFRWHGDWIKGISRRQKTALDGFIYSGYEIRSFESALSFRMIIGLGGSHPQETSMTLHHIYGIPYIPGSALKGVTRHWVILSGFDNDEGRAEQDKNFKDIFGAQAQTGKIIFFDAYPDGHINLKMDIMNPHYPDYYSKGSPPADWQSPTPIKFLTVEKTRFKFFLASRDKNLVDKATEWLKEALQNYGIGAKTSLGYGFFEAGKKNE